MDGAEAFKLGFVTYAGVHGRDFVGAIEKLAFGPVAAAIGASIGVPYLAGTVGGAGVETGLSADADAPDDLRRKYLIKRYRDLIRMRRARLQNAAVSAAKAGA